MKLNLNQYFADVVAAAAVELMKIILGRDFEVRFGQYFEVKFLVKMLMIG